MAAIVGLLVLMVYLCTNIAYKFIPDKAKKNVKRMFTRKKDGAATEDEPGGIKRGRSVVEAGLSFRDTVLDFFFLREPGDRETVTLLMRGMPIPATYGFPDTDGTMKANAFEFVKQFHPSISICYVHPLHPFTARERFIVYMCTVAFNFVWTAAEIYCYAKGCAACIPRRTTSPGRRSGASWTCSTPRASRRCGASTRPSTRRTPTRPSSRPWTTPPPTPRRSPERSARGPRPTRRRRTRRDF